MLIYIHGSDTFRSRDYLRQTIARFKKERDPQGYNVILLDGARDEEEKIMDALISTPFLAPKRMIVIDNLLARKSADLLDTIAEYIKNKRLAEDNVYVFWQDEETGKTKVAKDLEILLKKEKWAVEFKPLGKDKLLVWVAQNVKQRGGQISKPAINYLVEHAGEDLWRLNSLIDQLAAYKKEEIQLPDAQLFLEEKIDDNIFSLVDAAVSGNKKLAFKLLEGQRRKGEDDGYIYSVLLRQFRILIEMRDLFNRKDTVNSETMAKILGIHPYAAKKSLPFMKKYSLEQLKHIYKELLNIDIKTKTGAAPQSLLLDVFVGKI